MTAPTPRDVLADRAEGLTAELLGVEVLARAMHLARLAPDREEPCCDQPLTDADLANHMRLAEAVLWALSLIPEYARETER